MNVELSRLMDNARVRLPGAIDTAIQLELFAVLNEFFQDSNCWYEDISLNVTPNVTSYSIVPSSTAAPVRLIGVANSSNQMQMAVFDLPSTLTLIVAPSQADTFTARLVLTVDDPVSSEGFPDCPEWALNKYQSDILDGVLGRMMSQIAKPYTNERMAIYHTRKFRGAVAQAKVEAQHGNIYRGQNWRFPQTFARRNPRSF